LPVNQPEGGTGSGPGGGEGARKAGNKYTNSVGPDQFEVMRYPDAIGPVASGGVLPKCWCPQAAVTKAEGPTMMHTAANEGRIGDAGGGLVTMVARDGHWGDQQEAGRAARRLHREKQFEVNQVPGLGDQPGQGPSGQGEALFQREGSILCLRGGASGGQTTTG
jgi:hypothetical protein